MVWRLKLKRNVDSADLNEFRGIFSSYQLIKVHLSILSPKRGKKSSGVNAETRSKSQIRNKYKQALRGLFVAGTSEANGPLKWKKKRSAMNQD